MDTTINKPAVATAGTNIEATNIAISGKAVVGSIDCSGEAVFSGNVRVEGWLDAPNLRAPCKGLFDDIDSLHQACPVPQPGAWAIVGTSWPAEIFRVERGRWIPTGQSFSGGEIPCDRLQAEIDSLERRIDLSEAYIETNTVHHIEAPIADSGNEANLTLYNRHGGEIASCVIPVGSGDGSSSAVASDISDIRLTMSIDNPVIRQGDSARLIYNYDHIYIVGSDTGQSTGTKATVTLTLKRDGVIVHTVTRHDTGKGRYIVDLTPYLGIGTTEIYLSAVAIDPASGATRTRQRYSTCFVSALSLVSTYDLEQQMLYYRDTQYIEIPFSIVGSGSIDISLKIDGEVYAERSYTSTGRITDSFQVSTALLSTGSHSALLSAIAHINDNEGIAHDIRTQSIYMTFLKGDVPYVGIMINALDENPGDELVIETAKYQPVTFDYAVYNPASDTAEVVINEGISARTLYIGRNLQHYINRFEIAGWTTIAITCADAVKTIEVHIAEGDINIDVAGSGLEMQLSAAGRSNNETAPATWTSRAYTTTFEGVDWKTSGWTGESLRLINGAKAVIGNHLFATDVTRRGYTFEVEFFVDNISDRTIPLIHCIDQGKGFSITSEEIMYTTGHSETYTDENGDERTRQIKLSTNYVSGLEGTKKRWIKVAHTIRNANDAPVMELYVDGNRVGADVYDLSSSLSHTTPRPITIDSAGADIEIRSIRVYNRALSDDEILDNMIADTPDAEKKLALYNENAVTGENGVDMGELRRRGKGVIRIIHNNTDTTTGTNPLDDIFATNNKSRDFVADVYYFPSNEAIAAGAREFVAKDCYIRIQGTSSTKYPSKNIRIYLGKGRQGHQLLIGGEIAQQEKYPLNATTPAQSVLCAKTDYSDSSMSLNTGGARLFNETFKTLGLFTPPQRFQYEQADMDASAITTRTAIDGWPVDVFAAHSVEGENTYYGQYNLNNEKSKSAEIFGMDGVDGFAPICPLAFETLNNSKAMCLFSCSGETAEEIEAWMSNEESDDSPICNFDAALEVNYSAHGADGDVKWATLTPTERSAVVRLWKWIHDCVPEGADSDDLSTWVSWKFADEASDHFDVDFLLTYYIWTDYFLSVDQRAKNILLRTWDGEIWYPTYYDGDTQMGKSNDSFMSYRYDTTRDSYDARLGKYAFEGRSSWLWNLCLANFEDRMRICAARLREVLSNSRVLDMLNRRQSGNWCDRVFNKSGYLKYIRPAIETVYGQKWQFIYALQGRNAPHREYFVRNRFAVLDARYCCGGYRDDNIDLYLQQGTPGAPATSVLRIIPSESYAFGYSTNNPGMSNAILGASGVVTPPDEAVIAITGIYTANDPLRVYGASRIARLDATGASGNFKNGLKLQQCTALKHLNLSVPDGGTPSTAWWIEIDGCRKLLSVNLKGQSSVHTGSVNSAALDFSAQTRLESLDARGTSVESVILAPGAPVTDLRLPATLTSLRLENLPCLTTAGLSVEGYRAIRELRITGCGLIDAKDVVAEWLADEGTKQTLTLEDVDWTLTSAQLLTDIATKVSEVNITGSIDARNVYLLDDEYAALVDKFGAECFSPGGALYIRIGGTAIFTSESNPELYALFAAAGKVPVARPDQIGKMTQANAQAITKDELYNIWFNKAQNVRSFDEFRFFTGVTEIKDSTFMNSSALESITLPTSVTKIGMAAFAGCVKLHTLCSLRTTAPTVQYESAFGLGPSTGYEYTGRDVTGAKLLIVPVNATGYDSGKWTQLTAANKCGFTLSKTLV